MAILSGLDKLVEDAEFWKDLRNSHEGLTYQEARQAISHWRERKQNEPQADVPYLHAAIRELSERLGSLEQNVDDNRLEVYGDLTKLDDRVRKVEANILAHDNLIGGLVLRSGEHKRAIRTLQSKRHLEELKDDEEPSDTVKGLYRFTPMPVEEWCSCDPCRDPIPPWPQPGSGSVEAVPGVYLNFNLGR